MRRFFRTSFYIDVIIKLSIKRKFYCYTYYCGRHLYVIYKPCIEIIKQFTVRCQIFHATWIFDNYKFQLHCAIDFYNLFDILSNGLNSNTDMLIHLFSRFCMRNLIDFRRLDGKCKLSRKLDLISTSLSDVSSQ